MKSNRVRNAFRRSSHSIIVNERVVRRQKCESKFRKFIKDKLVKVDWNNLDKSIDTFFSNLGQKSNDLLGNPKFYKVLGYIAFSVAVFIIVFRWAWFHL